MRLDFLSGIVLSPKLERYNPDSQDVSEGFFKELELKNNSNLLQKQQQIVTQEYRNAFRRLIIAMRAYNKQAIRPLYEIIQQAVDYEKILDLTISELKTLLPVGTLSEKIIQLSKGYTLDFSSNNVRLLFKVISYLNVCLNYWFFIRSLSSQYKFNKYKKTFHLLELCVQRKSSPYFLELYKILHERKPNKIYLPKDQKLDLERFAQGLKTYFKQEVPSFKKLYFCYYVTVNGNYDSVHLSQHPVDSNPFFQKMVLNHLTIAEFGPKTHFKALLSILFIPEIYDYERGSKIKYDEKLSRSLNFINLIEKGGDLKSIDSISYLVRCATAKYQKLIANKIKKQKNVLKK
jgi:hypothetical protein